MKMPAIMPITTAKIAIAAHGEPTAVTGATSPYAGAAVA